MKKIYYILLGILVSIVVGRYSYLYFYKHDYYYEKYLNISEKIVYGLDAPRGRILDRSGKVLVDNVGVNTIIFHKLDGIDTESVANKLNEILMDKELASEEELKNYYMKHNDTDFLLTEDEKELYNHRKLTTKEVEELKMERLDEYIGQYSEEDNYKIHLYYLLNEGYVYSNKVIAKEVDDQTCAVVNSANIPGLTCEYTVKRIYLYDTMNDLYGTVGNISKENKSYYLDRGYELADQVGLSYLEKEYDDYLKGEKSKYLVNDDNSLTLIEEAKKGNDLVLSIDIDLQLKINEILVNNINKASSLQNTDYYNTSYVIVSDPNTGEIIASSGLSKVNGNFYDVTGNILTSSFTVGSVIKGASMSVGYENGLIEKGKKINDSCVKLYQVPMKCSYKRLGYIDDITALKTSSNYYQFMLAIKSTGNTYKNNMKLEVTK